MLLHMPSSENCLMNINYGEYDDVSIRHRNQLVPKLFSPTSPFDTVLPLLCKSELNQLLAKILPTPFFINVLNPVF